MPKGIPKEKVNRAIEGFTYVPTREEFVRNTALNIVFELVRHNGKVNPDYPTIAVKSASDLADLLGIGVDKPKKPKATELINIVQDDVDNDE